MSEANVDAVVRRLRQHALPDPHDEREVLHAPLLSKAADTIEMLNETLIKIEQWCEAYPLDIFPEPDFKKAAQILKENGMTIDAISASSMRHVLKGIKDIIDA